MSFFAGGPPKKSWPFRWRYARVAAEGPPASRQSIANWGSILPSDHIFGWGTKAPPPHITFYAHGYFAPNKQMSLLDYLERWGCTIKVNVHQRTLVSKLTIHCPSTTMGRWLSHDNSRSCSHICMYRGTQVKRRSKRLVPLTDEIFSDKFIPYKVFRRHFYVILGFLNQIPVKLLDKKLYVQGKELFNDRKCDQR